MDTKLTLKLDKDVIDKAKDYAKSHKVSLSKMVETYLESVAGQESRKAGVTPLVESLTGVIKNNAGDKQGYRDYLSEKYK